MQQNNNHTSYQLPGNTTVAMYVRQTTHKQYADGWGTDTQQADLLRATISRMGVPDDHIIVIHDAPASAENSRTGMQTLIDHILQGDIQAMFVSHERSLFSDEHTVSATTFLKLCQERNILICTPRTVYNVSHPYDAHLFRLHTEDAHIYIQQYVCSRLHRAKEQAALHGCYDGRPCHQDTLLTGKDTVQRKRTRYTKRSFPMSLMLLSSATSFKQYVEFCGRMNDLYTTLQKMPVLFPEFDGAIDQGATSRTTLKKVIRRLSPYLRQLEIYACRQ